MRFGFTERSSRVAVLAAALIICGCSGGGGTSASGTGGGNTGGGGTGGTNGPPTISGAAPSIVVIGETYTFTPGASDPDGDSLTFSISNIPSWGSFDSTTGTLSGSPDNGDVGPHSGISISVSDGSTSSSITAFTINVTEVGDLSVTLNWNPPTLKADGSTLDDLASYKFYYGFQPDTMTNSIYVDSPGISSYTIDNLTSHTYYFSITAVNGIGAESQFSNFAAWTP